MNEQSSAPSRDILVPISILVAGILIAGSVIYVAGLNNAPVAPVTTQGANAFAAILTPLPDDAVLGDEDAPVTMIEYGDYQCPYCGVFFNDIEPKIRDEYVKTGKVKLIFRNFQFLGPESYAAGEAAECARAQGKFWTYHDALYRVEIADEHENNGNLTRDLFMRLAEETGLDSVSFGTCIDSHTYASLVESEVEGGRAVGVNATPTSFVNGTLIRGLAQNDTRVIDAINAALKGQ
ncbi:MAG: DsbA family protein [Patescibacteria group bacterium]|nr:DsbA family protein [Patescibacteria group bacterium]